MLSEEALDGIRRHGSVDGNAALLLIDMAERAIAWEPIVRAAMEWKEADFESEPVYWKPIVDAIVACPPNLLPEVKDE